MRHVYDIRESQRPRRASARPKLTAPPLPILWSRRRALLWRRHPFLLTQIEICRFGSTCLRRVRQFWQFYVTKMCSHIDVYIFSTTLTSPRLWRRQRFTAYQWRSN